MITNNANMNKKTNEVYTSSVEFFNNEETMTKENQSTALIKYNVVEQARIVLEEKKKFLVDNANADKNIIKSAQVNINEVNYYVG